MKSEEEKKDNELLAGDVVKQLKLLPDTSDIFGTIYDTTLGKDSTGASLGLYSTMLHVRTTSWAATILLGQSNEPLSDSIEAFNIPLKTLTSLLKSFPESKPIRIKHIESGLRVSCGKNRYDLAVTYLSSKPTITVPEGHHIVYRSGDIKDMFSKMAHIVSSKATMKTSFIWIDGVNKTMLASDRMRLGVVKPVELPEGIGSKDVYSIQAAFMHFATSIENYEIHLWPKRAIGIKWGTGKIAMSLANEPMPDYTGLLKSAYDNVLLTALVDPKILAKQISRANDLKAKSVTIVNNDNKLYLLWLSDNLNVAIEEIETIEATGESLQDGDINTVVDPIFLKNALSVLDAPVKLSLGSSESDLLISDDSGYEEVIVRIALPEPIEFPSI